MFASIAQFERERISERTKEGLTAARKRGRVGGRPPALSAERCAEVARMRDNEGRGIAELARLFEVSPSTIRRATSTPYPNNLPNLNFYKTLRLPVVYHIYMKILKIGLREDHEIHGRAGGKSSW